MADPIVRATVADPQKIVIPEVRQVGAVQVFNADGTPAVPGGLLGTIGIDQTTPGTTNAVVVGAGSAIIGTVGIDQTTPGTTDSVSVKSQSYFASVSSPRPADTAPYLANDVLGEATGFTVAMEFEWLDRDGNPPPAGSVLTIVGSQFRIDVGAIPSGMTGFRLYFYSEPPPSALGDNAPFDLPAGDREAFLGGGYIDLGSPVDLGSTLYVEQNGINKTIKLVGATSFVYLVTIGAFTPTSGTVKVVGLFAVVV